MTIRPRIHRAQARAWLASIAAVAVFCLPALAGLGGDASSVQADQIHMQATLRTTRAQAYTLHEMQTPEGTAVREYVSPAGKVFAVAWQGPFLPDMTQLLGSYFEQYSQAAQAPRAHRGGHGPLVIQQPGLVVESGGHMRSLFGRAYVPDLLPEGVSANAIR